MSLKRGDSIMILYKGDTFTKNIVLENYELQPKDTLLVGIKKRITDTEYILPVLRLTNLKTQFEYTSEQTDSIQPDTYILEIKLLYADNKIATLKQEELQVKGVVIDE